MTSADTTAPTHGTASQAEELLRPGANGAEWYVFRTRPRREKKAAEMLREIDAVCERGTGLKLYPQLTRGKRVRVVSGPLAGVLGRVSRRKEGFRLVVNVSALGTAVAAELNMEDVVPLEVAEARPEQMPAASRWRTRPHLLQAST